MVAGCPSGACASDAAPDVTSMPGPVMAPVRDSFGGVVGEGRSRTIRVPWSPSAVPEVRRAAVADLRARHVPAATVDEAEIVLSELVSNAVRHARALPDGTIRVHWTVTAGVIEVEVSDGGSDTIPRPAPLSALAPAGRGLRIVRSLAHEWGVLPDPRGNTVWASLGGPSRRRVLL